MNTNIDEDTFVNDSVILLENENETIEKPKWKRYASTLTQPKKIEIDPLPLTTTSVTVKPSSNRFGPTSLKAKANIQSRVNRLNRINSTINPYQTRTIMKSKSIKLGLEGKIEDTMDLMSNFKL